MFAIWLVTSIAMTSGGWISIIGKSANFCGFAVVEGLRVYWCNCEASSIHLYHVNNAQFLNEMNIAGQPCVHQIALLNLHVSPAVVIAQQVVSLRDSNANYPIISLPRMCFVLWCIILYIYNFALSHLYLQLLNRLPFNSSTLTRNNRW